MWKYLMKSKSKAFQFFVNFVYLFQNQFGENIKRIKSDNGTEYANYEFSKFNTSQHWSCKKKQNRYHLLPCRVFECYALVHSHTLNHSKLHPRARKCTFIGNLHHGYHLWGNNPLPINAY